MEPGGSEEQENNPRRSQGATRRRPLDTKSAGGSVREEVTRMTRSRRSRKSRRSGESHCHDIYFLCFPDVEKDGNNLDGQLLTRSGAGQRARSGTSWTGREQVRRVILQHLGWDAEHNKDVSDHSSYLLSGI